MEGNRRFTFGEERHVIDLRKRKIFSGLFFIEFAKAFLSIQASSAEIERVFGDSGYEKYS